MDLVKSTLRGRLKKLDISKNNITIIDQDTLIVPSGLEELIMYGNRVTEIKPNVKWPSNLQILDLNQNILEQANNFPYTLKNYHYIVITFKIHLTGLYFLKN